MQSDRPSKNPMPSIFLLLLFSSPSFKSFDSFPAEVPLLRELAQKATKKYAAKEKRRVTERERLCVFLVSSWEVGEGCERPHCWCQGQSASKGWFRLREASFSRSHASARTHTYSVPHRPPKSLKNVVVYCSSSQPKNNIWNWCVNSDWGQGAHSDMVQCVCVCERGTSEVFLVNLTSTWLKLVISECFGVSADVKKLFSPFALFIQTLNQ